MAQKLGRKIPIDFRPVVDKLGVSALIDQVGLGRVIAEVGLDRVIAEVGLDRVIAEVGLDRVIAEADQGELLEKLLSKLSPAKKRELKRRLEGTG